MPFDINQGFQVGQQAAAGGAGLGAFIKTLNDRIEQHNQLQNQFSAQSALKRMEPSLAGQTEEEKLKGMGRFYTSPEGESYIGSLGKRGQAMLGSLNSPQAQGSVQGQQGIDSGLSYSPEYGVIGATIDPLNPEATKYTIGETPQSKIKGSIAEQVGKTVGERSSKLKLAQDQMETIKRVLGTILPIQASKTMFSPAIATGRGALFHAMGTMNPKFADIESTLKQAVPLFVQSVGNISSGRLNNQELNLMGQSLLQLPYLDDVSQQRRLKLIDQLLEKGGVSLRLGGSAPVASQQEEDFSQISDEELRRIANQ